MFEFHYGTFGQHLTHVLPLLNNNIDTPSSQNNVVKCCYGSEGKNGVFFFKKLKKGFNTYIMWLLRKIEWRGLSELSYKNWIQIVGNKHL